jgi:hypothetical protein
MYKSKYQYSFGGVWAEQELFLFSLGRIQKNWSVVPRDIS